MNLTLDPPDHCVTRYVIRVRFGDTDLMGIAHHASYLSYFEAGRVEYLHRRGVEYLSWVRHGVHLPVIEAQVRYRRAARFDDRLIIETRLSGLRRVRMRFDYRVLRPEPGNREELIAEGCTALACVDQNHAPRRIPSEVAEVLLAPETLIRPIDQV